MFAGIARGRLGLSTRTSNMIPTPVKTAGSILLALFVLVLTLIAVSRSSGGDGVSLSDGRRRRERRSPSFSVEFGDPVAMRIAASAHYTIDTKEGAEEWAKLIPPGPSGHLVYLPSPSSPSSLSIDAGANANAETKTNATLNLKPYTITLFHQLKCLDIIRRQYLRPPPPIEPILKETKHCMNYLRQTVLCRPNLWLESAKNVVGTASRAYDAVCHNWEAVYDAAARNHQELVELGFAGVPHENGNSIVNRSPRSSIRH